MDNKGLFIPDPPGKLRKRGQLLSLCNRVASDYLKAWRDLHLILGHEAYKRGSKAKCKTCQLERIITEFEAYQILTGQSVLEAEAFFAKIESDRLKYRGRIV